MTDNFPEARRWADEYTKTTGGAKAYIAHQLAAAGPALLAKVDELTAELAKAREDRDLNGDLLDSTAKALGMDLTDPDVHYAYSIPTKVAEVVAALNEARRYAADRANEVGRLASENARVRQQRDEVTAKADAGAALYTATRAAIQPIAFDLDERNPRVSDHFTAAFAAYRAATQRTEATEGTR